MDLSNYEKSATYRARMVLRKAEELCRERKYASITPCVIFAAITMLEKDFLLEFCDRCGLDFNNVCKACELELGEIQTVDDVCDCKLSESAQELLSAVMREYSMRYVLELEREINVDRLMAALLSCAEMKSVFGTNYTTPGFLHFDTLTGEFITLDRIEGKYSDKEIFIGNIDYF